MTYEAFLYKIRGKKYSDILLDLITIGIKAKDEVLKYYHDGFKVETKSDKSPVTSADLASNKIICEYLKNKYPSYAILSEESTDDLKRLENDRVFIIDPIDGTADFVDKDDEFSINLAFAVKGEIKVGVIIIPALNYCYFSYGHNPSYFYDLNENFIKIIHVSEKTDNLTVLTSRKHEVDLNVIKPIKHLVKDIKPCGSSYKGCLIAQGDADMYFNHSQNTKEWDVAPIDIIVTNAGGVFLTLNKMEKFIYNKKDPYNRDGFLCMNRSDYYIKK